MLTTVYVNRYTLNFLSPKIIFSINLYFGFLFLFGFFLSYFLVMLRARIMYVIMSNGESSHEIFVALTHMFIILQEIKEHSPFLIFTQSPLVTNNDHAMFSPSESDINSVGMSNKVSGAATSYT